MSEDSITLGLTPDLYPTDRLADLATIRLVDDDTGEVLTVEVDPDA